jgi:RND family efflux transporter MFP subunit
MSDAMPAPGRSRATRALLSCALAVAAAAGGVLFLAVGKRSAEAREARDRQASVAAGPVVRTARVELARGGRLVSLTGEVRAWRQAVVYAKVSGYLRTLLVEKGDRVREGQVLGTLESPDADEQVAGAEAEVELRRQQARRARDLAPSGVVSRQELDQAEGALRLAEAALARARALQAYATLRAPFAGVVTARFVDPGALLPAATGSTSAAQPVLEVSDMDRLRVLVYLSQDDALAAREGDEAVLLPESPGEAPLPARVTHLSRSLDPRTRTMQAEVVVDNVPARMYPGQFVKVQLRLARPERPLVPADALVFRGESPSVAVLEGKRVRLVKIVAGEHDGRNVEVLQGLRGGEVVALDASGLPDGSPVQPAEPGAGAGARAGTR